MGGFSQGDIFDQVASQQPPQVTSPDIFDQVAPEPRPVPQKPVRPVSAQVTQAHQNIAQYPENQMPPDPAYLAKKAAYQNLPNEPGIPPFEEDPEQERRIKAQQEAAAGKSLIPEFATPALAAAKKYAVDPFERASAAGAKAGGEMLEGGLADPSLGMDPELAALTGVQPQTAEGHQAQVAKFQKEHPRAAGVTRAAGEVAGGLAADPRMWPFFFAGPETAPVLRGAIGAGFTGQMAAGAVQQSGELGKIIDDPDIPQDQKWELGANAVISALMAGTGGAHTVLREFQALPPNIQEEIRTRVRQEMPEAAAEIDKRAAAPQAAKPAGDIFDQVAPAEEAKPKPERFRLPKGVSAQEVQGPVKGPNIRTVQVGDKTYAFDQRKVNADGVTRAVERGEMWRLTGGKAPEAAKVQAEQDIKGEEPESVSDLAGLERLIRQGLHDEQIAKQAQAYFEKGPPLDDAGKLQVVRSIRKVTKLLKGEEPAPQGDVFDQVAEKPEVEQPQSAKVQEPTTEEPKFKKASTQINIEPSSELGKAHAEAVRAIPEEQVGPINGRENEPHVTLRYGLKDDSPEAIAKLKEAASKIPAFEVPVGKTGTFPASEHSDGEVPVVAHLEVTPELKALRKAVEDAGAFDKDSFPEYKPHVTLAYVKPEFADQYKSGNQLEGQKVPVDHITVSKRDGSQEVIPLGKAAPPERRQTEGQAPEQERRTAESPRRQEVQRRKTIDEMTPEEKDREIESLRQDLTTSEKTGLPNRRAFDEAEHSPAVAMSDADGLKALNDKYGYEAGDALLRAKAEALTEAGLDAYHEKGDEFLYRGDSPEAIKEKLEQAREILKSRIIEFRDRETGKLRRFSGADFSYGTGTDLTAAESGLKAHKSEREARGERARGELRNIAEIRSEEAPVRESAAPPEKPAEALPAQVAAPAPAKEPIGGRVEPPSEREKWPDGRLKPRVGDEVSQMVAGFGGTPAYIHGVVEKNRNGDLRVRTTGSSSFFGSAPTGKTYPADQHWTVKGDPEIERRRAAREAKEQEQKQAVEKEYADRAERKQQMIEKHGKLDASTVKVGDVIEDYDGQQMVVRQIVTPPSWSKNKEPELYVVPPDKLNDSPGFAGAAENFHVVGHRDDVPPMPEPEAPEQAEEPERKRQPAREPEKPAAQFDEAVKQTGAEVKAGQPSPEFAEKIAKATHLEPANDADLKEKFTGAAYQREYFKAALQEAKNAWAATMNGRGDGIEMFEFIAKKGSTEYIEKNAPEGLKTPQLYIKVPEDGHFLVNNWPNAIERALKGAQRGFAAFRPAFNPNAKPAKFTMPKATPEDVEKYRKGLTEELDGLVNEQEGIKRNIKDHPGDVAELEKLKDDRAKEVKAIEASDKTRTEKRSKLEAIKERYDHEINYRQKSVDDFNLDKEKAKLVDLKDQIALAKENLDNFNGQFPAKAQTLPASESHIAPGSRSAFTGNETGMNEMQQLTKTIAANAKGKSLRERLQFGADTGQRESAGNSVSESLGRIKGRMAALWDAYRTPPKWGDYETSTGRWSGAEQASALDLQRFTRAIKQTVRDKSIRDAMSNWIEAGGDEKVLQERADKSDAKFKSGYEKALNLTDEQKAMARNIMGLHDATLKEAQAAGLIEHGVENYIQHVYSDKPKLVRKIMAEMNFNSLNPKPSFTKKRVLPTYFDAEQLGFTPKDKDVAYLTAVHERSLREALAARAYIRSLMEGKASDGRPLVATSWASAREMGEAPDSAYLIKPNIPLGEEYADYKKIDHPALRGWKWSGEVDGKPIFVQGDALVHPEIYRKLKNNLSTSALRSYETEIMGHVVRPGAAVLNFQNQIKQFILSFSAFHQTTLGLHALEHRTRPGLLPELDLNNEKQSKLVDHGLMVAHYDAEAEFAEGVAGGGVVTKVPGIGPLYNTYREYLFKSYLPRVKMQMALNALERNTEAYKGKLSEDQIYGITASQANAAFGGLNYRMLGRNKTFQDTLRLAMMAPDFTEARARFAGQSLKPYGREQRIAFIGGALALYTLARLLNEELDGQAHWDKPFAVVHRGKEYSLRSVQGDVLNLLEDPPKFFGNRLSPALRAMTESDDKFKKKHETLMEKVKGKASEFAPIPIQAWLQKGHNSNAHKAFESMLKMIGVNEKKVSHR